MLDEKRDTVIHVAMKAFAMPNAELALFMMGVLKTADQQLDHLELPEDVLDLARTVVANFLPEISARLCRMDNIHLAHQDNPYLSSLDNAALRMTFSEMVASDEYQALAAHMSSEDRDHLPVTALDVVVSIVANGNIFAIALDRLCEGELDDNISKIVRTTSNIRGVAHNGGRWTPEVSENIVSHTPDEATLQTLGLQVLASDLEMMS